LNILDLLQADGIMFNRVASTRGGEFAGPCPFCKDGKDRFRVWPEQGYGGRWWCRQCGRSGDAIQYLRDYRRITYLEACQYLSREPQLSPLVGRRSSGRPAWEPRATYAPGDLWQAKARKLVDDAVYDLWAPGGQPMLDFLTEKRGLNKTTIKKFSLGFIPVDKWASAMAWGLEEVLKDDGKPKKLWFPRGLAVPLCRDGQVLRVRIRRPKSDGEPRYYILRGSDTRAMILGRDKSISLLVESELDALLLYQEAGDLVNLISLGNAQTRPDKWTANFLNQSKLVLLALDADEAGALESWRWWRANYSQAHRWPPIMGKDPGDMLAASVNLRAWIEAGVDEYEHKSS
jgi:DNA primase